MGITYKIDVEFGVIYAFGEGDIGAAEIREVRERIAADALFHSELNSLFDARLATFSFSGEEAQSLANQVKQNRPNAKTSIVINSDKWSQGYIRMYAVWAGDGYKIFYDMEPAREWLGLPPE